MSKTSSPSKQHRPPGTVLRLLMCALALAGLGVSVFLWFTSLGGGQVPGCGEGIDCAAVLNSPWSKWLGVPLAAMASANYLCILVALMFIGAGRPVHQQRGAWIVLIASTVAAAATGLWMTGLMFSKLEDRCPYCLIVHACSIVLVLLVLIKAPIRAGSDGADSVALDPIRAGIFSLIGFAGVIALMLGQTLYREPSGDSLIVERYIPPAEPSKPAPPLIRPPKPPLVKPKAAAGDRFDDPDRRVVLLEGKVRVQPHKAPLLGKPSAPYVILSLFDYTCSHCRKMHGYLNTVRARYGDELAIVALPVPLEAQCNKNIKKTGKGRRDACILGRLAMRVWRYAPTKFDAFDNWLFTGKKAPSKDDALERAKQVIGEARFQEVLYNPWPRRQIEKNVMLHGSLPRRTLPIVVLKDHLSFGIPKTNEEFFQLFEEKLGIQPVEHQ